jgi:uncharacterized repeat protein (TIGR04138 family)
MNSAQKSSPPRPRFHPGAYRFLFEALRHTQQRLGRAAPRKAEDERAHISGQELLEGIRDLALAKFGLMARTVFHCWGIHTTEDFGHMVFELIERGEMSKTDSDHLSDFYGVYDFAEVFEAGYQVDLSNAR